MRPPTDGSIYRHKKLKTKWVVINTANGYVNLREHGSGQGKMTISLNGLGKVFTPVAETETAR